MGIMLIILVKLMPMRLLVVLLVRLLREGPTYGSTAGDYPGTAAGDPILAYAYLNDLGTAGNAAPSAY